MSFWRAFERCRLFFLCCLKSFSHALANEKPQMVIHSFTSISRTTVAFASVTLAVSIHHWNNTSALSIIALSICSLLPWVMFVTLSIQKCSHTSSYIAQNSMYVPSFTCNSPPLPTTSSLQRRWQHPPPLHQPVDPQENLKDQLCLFEMTLQSLSTL